MRQAAEAIDTGEVTQAVRASNTEAGPVAEGEWMGIVRGEGIVAIAPDALGAAQRLLEHLLADAAEAGRELVTVITGADASADDTAALQAWFADRFADLELEHHEGGQPLYPYLFGVE